MKGELTATCTFGLESELKYELIKLGYEITGVTDGAVSVNGGAEDILKLNLWLRCANRVMLKVTQKEAKTFDELFEAVNSSAWENYLPKDAKFDVERISCVKSALYSKRDCQKIIKKAVVERLKKHYKTNLLPETGAEYPLCAAVKNDIASVYIDTTGASLHKRGYRTQAGEAPVKETLAAGIVMLSRYKGNREFADFMCGSGTIVTEAAMIAANIAPGLTRDFAFDKWGILTPKNRASITEEAAGKKITPEYRLLGSDIDTRAIYRAKQNAIRAGVDDICFFQKIDMRQFSSKKRDGLIVVNPPYGERIGRGAAADELYKDMRYVYDSLDDWSMSVLCANPDFQRDFGKKADKNRKLYNGNMLAYLYMYSGKDREKK